MRSILAAMMMGLLCMGCVPRLDLAREMDKYRLRESCCRTLAELPAVPIVGDSLHFALLANSPLVELPAFGVTHVQLFRLPATRTSSVVKVSSYLFADGYPARRMAAVLPIITSLDAARRPLASTRPSDIVWSPSRFADEPNRLARLEVSMAVPPESAARYVIVHSAEFLIGTDATFETVSHETGFMVGSVVVIIPPSKSRAIYRAAPVCPADGMRISLQP